MSGIEETAEEKLAFVTEAMEMFKVKAGDVKEIEKASYTISELDLEGMGDFVRSIVESFKFTGFNPSDFYEYLMREIFTDKSPTFPMSKAQSLAVISAVISLFIMRGNKLSAKNEERMSTAGKAKLDELRKALKGVFKTKYKTNELTAKTITPARMAATFPVTTAMMFQQIEGSRVVGMSLTGVPKGFLCGQGFALVPRSCPNLHKAIGIWRDTFTEVINPKARSAAAIKVSKISAYKFSMLQYGSDFVRESTRSQITTKLSMLAYEKGTALQKVSILYWVDHVHFFQQVLRSAPGAKASESKVLEEIGIMDQVISELTDSEINKLKALLSKLWAEIDLAGRTSFATDKLLVPIEAKVTAEEMNSIGTIGGADQGSSFENILL